MPCVGLFLVCNWRILSSENCRMPAEGLSTFQVPESCHRWGHCRWSSDLCNFWRRLQDRRIYLASFVLCSLNERSSPFARRLGSCFISKSMNRLNASWLTLVQLGMKRVKDRARCAQVFIVTEMVFVKFIVDTVPMSTWTRVYYNNTLCLA